jgi:hypothetical protein
MYIPAILPKSHVLKIKEQETTTNRVRNWRLFVGNYRLQHPGMPIIKPCRRKSPPGCNRQVLGNKTAKMSFYFPTITDFYAYRENDLQLYRIMQKSINLRCEQPINLTHRVKFIKRYSTDFRFDFCFLNTRWYPKYSGLVPPPIQQLW